MSKTELDHELALACQKPRPYLKEIKRLILAGADTNQSDENGANIFCRVFSRALSHRKKNPSKTTEIVEQIKDVILTMVDNGWDVGRFGLNVMNSFIFTTYDHFTFDLYKFMLQFDLADDSDEYNRSLGSVATEESYQRCCENNHATENLFYSIYELIYAKKKGQDLNGIALYEDAIGITVDKILYFNNTNTLVEKADFTEYNADIGLVSGEKVLILSDGVNILFMNDRISELPQLDISSQFDSGIINNEIKSISFSHKELETENHHYGQPTITLEFTSGKKLNFTHNFGELPDNNYQSRFWIEQSNSKSFKEENYVERNIRI